MIPGTPAWLMPIVLSVEGVPALTYWGFLPVLLLCRVTPLLVWPSAPMSASSKSAGAQPRATGLLKKALDNPAGSTLEEVACSLRSWKSAYPCQGWGFHMTYKVVCPGGRQAF